MITINLQTVKLTDGSRVFDVSVAGFPIHAHTEADAVDIAHKLRDAIAAGAVDAVRITYSDEG